MAVTVVAILKRIFAINYYYQQTCLGVSLLHQE